MRRKDALKAAKKLVKAPVDPQLDKSKLQAAVDAAKAKTKTHIQQLYNAMEKFLQKQKNF